MPRLRFIHCGGDIVEQTPRGGRAIPMEAAARSIADWRTAAAAHARLGSARIAGVYRRSAAELAAAAEAAQRWRRCAALPAPASSLPHQRREAAS